MVRKRFLIVLFLSFSSFVLANSADGDGDGYPDAVHVRDATDREAFRRWFAAVAEAQYTHLAEDWRERDCAGLLRYAFVEALKPKTAEWSSKFPYLPERNIPPVRGLSYPLPELSRSVFRIAPGPYRPGDVEEGRFVGLATAAELMRYSSLPLGRTPDVAERGDLLFFAHPLAGGSGYHSMVYLGDGMVVYHTGLSAEAGGEVRLLSLATLSKHPDSSWHPVPENPHFLGFYRWKIVY